MESEAPPQQVLSPTEALPDWPITAIVYGQAAYGVLCVVTAVGGLGCSFLLGGDLGVSRSTSGEWTGLGSMLTLLMVVGGLYSLVAGCARLAAAVGLHRRRRWSRFLTLTLSCLDLLAVPFSLFTSLELLLFELPVLALAIVSLVVLFRKDYAALFPQPPPPSSGGGVTAGPQEATIIPP